MTTYKMTTIDPGTRIRDLPNTTGKELTRVDANVTVNGDELFTAPENLTNTAVGIYQYIGDKWLKVTYNGVTGWMAYIHKGKPICKDFVVITTTPPTEPTSTFPEYFILTDPQGKAQRYDITR